MNDNILKIKWDTGESEINLNEFFPCGQRQLRKLIKMMDLELETKWENVQQCINHIENELCATANDVKNLEFAMTKARHNYDAIRNLLASNTKYSKYELKKLREQRNRYSRAYAEFKRERKALLREADKLIKNRDYLSELQAGRQIEWL